MVGLNSLNNVCSTFAKRSRKTLVNLSQHSSNEVKSSALLGDVVQFSGVSSPISSKAPLLINLSKSHIDFNTRSVQESLEKAILATADRGVNTVEAQNKVLNGLIKHSGAANEGEMLRYLQNFKKLIEKKTPKGEPLLHPQDVQHNCRLTKA